MHGQPCRRLELFECLVKIKKSLFRPFSRCSVWRWLYLVSLYIEGDKNVDRFSEGKAARLHYPFLESAKQQCAASTENSFQPVSIIKTQNMQIVVFNVDYLSK